LRVPVDVAMVGGRSDPRNAILHQMFSHLGFGERAGSGLFMISSVWKNKNWIKPELKDELNPNRTILTLYMKSDKKVGINAGINAGINVEINVEINLTQRKILDLMIQNQRITQEEIAQELKRNIRTIEKNINILKEKNIIERIGAKKTGYWTIKGEEDI